MQEDTDSFNKKSNVRATMIEVDERDISSKDDGYSMVGSILIGKPTRKQQIAVVVSGFLALFQTLGKFERLRRF
jgi:hypothetical protein